MPYFDPSADNAERIGKVVGDAIAAFLVLTIIIIVIISLTGGGE